MRDGARPPRPIGGRGRPVRAVRRTPAGLEVDLDGATLASAAGNVSASGPYRQAYANGAAIFGANEGCWVADGVVYFTDGQGPFPAQPPAVPTLWVLSKEEPFACPWGARAYILPARS